MLEMVALWGSWLFTFLLHSTVWLGGAWLLLRIFSSTTPAARDWLWKGALVGSLLSPTLQIGLGSAWGWSMSLHQLTGSTPTTTLSGSAKDQSRAMTVPEAVFFDLQPLDGLRAVVQNPAEFSVVPHKLLSSGQPTIAPMAALPSALPTDAVEDASSQLVSVFFIFWMCGVVFGLSLWALAWWGLRQQLQQRKPLPSKSLLGSMQADLAKLGNRRARRFRVSVSNRIAVPMAFGFWRDEICLPLRALEELSLLQQQSMFRHELAHLLRRDPFWLLLFYALQRVLFVQPLIFVARREAFYAAEELCDAWAIRRSGNRVALAECLGLVAQWLCPKGKNLPVACMARPGSPLGRRVDRLLDKSSRTAPRHPAASGSIAVGLVFLLAAMVAFAPGFREHAKTRRATPVVLDTEALLESWNLEVHSMQLLKETIADLQQQLASSSQSQSTAIKLQETLLKLQQKLLRLEQLSETIRWNILNPNPS